MNTKEAAKHHNAVVAAKHYKARTVELKQELEYVREQLAAEQHSRFGDGLKSVFRAFTYLIACAALTLGSTYIYFNVPTGLEFLGLWGISWVIVLFNS